MTPSVIKLASLIISIITEVAINEYFPVDVHVMPVELVDAPHWPFKSTLNWDSPDRQRPDPLLFFILSTSLLQLRKSSIITPLHSPHPHHICLHHFLGVVAGDASKSSQPDGARVFSVLFFILPPPSSSPPPHPVATPSILGANVPLWWLAAVCTSPLAVSVNTANKAPRITARLAH